jgi:hypothetical protein
VYDVAKLHPRKWHKTDSGGKLIKYSVCCTKTGFFCCGKRSLNKEINQYGAANLVYFRTLKALIFTLLFISIIQGVMIYSYYNNTSSNISTTSSTFDLINFINQFSLANRLTHFQMCEKISLKDIYNNDTSNTNNYFTVSNLNSISSPMILNLNCPTNHTVYPSFFGLSKFQNLENKNNENCVNYSFNQNINIDSSCDLTTWLNNQFLNQCANLVKDQNGTKYIFNLNSQQTPYTYNSNQCKITINSESLPSCVYNSIFNNYLYLTYTCYIKYTNFPFKIFDENFDLIQSSIDTISMLSLLICSIIIYYYSHISKEISREKFPSIDDYSIRIKNLNFNHKTFHAELNKLIYHIIRVLKLTERDKNSRSKNMLIFTSHCPIYEVNYPIFNYNLLNHVIKKEKMTQQLEILVEKYEKARNRGEVYIERYESEIRILKNKIAVQNNKIKFSDLNQDESLLEAKLDYVDDIYFTFKEIKNAKKIAKIYKNKNFSTRSLIILFCCKSKIEHLYFKNKWLDVELYPDTPGNISWLNSSFNPLARKGRKILNWIICVILIFLSWLIVYFLREKLLLLENEFITNIDCNKIDYKNIFMSMSDLTYSKNNSKLFCFCENLYSTQGNGYEYTLNYTYNNTYPCKNWMIAKNNLNIMIYITILAIPFLNLISRVIIKIIVIYENNQSKIEEKVSIFYKIFSVIFLNSSFSFIVFNSFIKEAWVENTYYPFFNGLYKDFGTAWYRNLGSVIMLISVVNVIEPHLECLGVYFYFTVKRIVDSGSMNGENSKLRIKKRFMHLYLSPEFSIESRYATVSLKIFF